MEKKFWLEIGAGLVVVLLVFLVGVSSGTTFFNKDVFEQSVSSENEITGNVVYTQVLKPVGRICSADNQCASGICDSQSRSLKICLASDVTLGNTCLINRQCDNRDNNANFNYENYLYCIAGICSPIPDGTLEHGVTCRTSWQCASGICDAGTCKGGIIGSPCTSTAQCDASTTCVLGYCNLYRYPYIARYSHIAGCVFPPLGMIGWWTGDNVIIPITQYISTNGINTPMFNTSSTGIISYLPGLVSSSFNFSGSAFLRSIYLGPTVSSFTIDAWIKLNRSLGTSEYQPIFVQWDEYSRRSFDKRTFAFVVGPNNVLRLDTSPDGNFYSGNTVSGGTLQPNRWYHVAATSNGITNSIFINGVSVATRTLVAQGITLYNGTTVDIAHSSSFAGRKRYFVGQIDELEFFNRGLTQGEIASIYTAGSSGKCKS